MSRPPAIVLPWQAIQRAEAEYLAPGAWHRPPLDRCDAFSYRPAGHPTGHPALASLRGYRGGKCLFHVLTNRSLANRPLANRSLD